MTTPLPDPQQVADDLWLRCKAVDMLQWSIQPGIFSGPEHTVDMARARRILWRWGVRPCTDYTVFEREVARALDRHARLRELAIQCERPTSTRQQAAD